MLLASGTGSADEIDKAKADSAGLGLFVRSLVGLDRAAAQQALMAFMDSRTHTANQIEFIQTIIENLTQSRIVEPGRLYEPPTRGSAAREWTRYSPRRRLCG
jgi:type I restriction enzyme R subunit